MTDVVVEESNEKIYATSAAKQIVVEENDSKIVAESEGKQIVVNQIAAADVVIDVSQIYVTTGQRPPDQFTPAQGQTVFTLSTIPVGNEILTIRVYVNRLKLLLGSYSIVGSQLTITGLPFQLNPTFKVEVYY